MIVTKEQVEAAFMKGGYTINERFKECGFIYFPTCAPFTKENPEQGRVFFKVDRHAYPDTQQGQLDKALDEQLGQVRDSFSTSASWGYPTEKQQREIDELIKLYVIFCRQQRGEWAYSISDRAALETGEVGA